MGPPTLNDPELPHPSKMQQMVRVKSPAGQCARLWGNSGACFPMDVQLLSRELAIAYPEAGKPRSLSVPSAIFKDSGHLACSIDPATRGRIDSVRAPSRLLQPNTENSRLKSFLTEDLTGCTRELSPLGADLLSGRDAPLSDHLRRGVCW